MTPPFEPFDPADEAVVDSWLARQHREMGIDLAAALELDTGLHEILLARQHREMGTDLARALNLDTGLAAILHEHKRPLPPPTPFETFGDLLDWLADVPMVRLAHRNQLRLLALDAEILHLASLPAIERVRDRDHSLDHALDRVRALDLDHARVLDRVLLLSQILDRVCAGARVLDLAIDLDHAIDLARAFDRNFAHDLARIRVRARDRAHAFNLARAFDRNFAHDLARILDHARILVVDRAPVHTIIRSVTIVRDRAYDLVRTLCGMLVHLGVGNLMHAINGQMAVDTSWLDPATISPQQTGRLNDLAADFTGVDLREAQLSGLDLIGVRWSRTTQWPAADLVWVIAVSARVGDGVYMIQGLSASGGVTVVPDPVTV